MIKKMQVYMHHLLSFFFTPATAPVEANAAAVCPEPLESTSYRGTIAAAELVFTRAALNAIVFFIFEFVVAVMCCAAILKATKEAAVREEEEKTGHNMHKTKKVEVGFPIISFDARRHFGKNTEDGDCMA